MKSTCRGSMVYCFDIARPNGEFSLVFNRMSPSLYLRGNGNGIVYTLQYLANLECAGTRLLNGSHALRVEISKTLQLSLREGLNRLYPCSRVINHPTQALAARALRYPIVIKENVGGSGAGIQKFDCEADLAKALQLNELDFGIYHTRLVQEFGRIREKIQDVSDCVRSSVCHL